MPGTPQEPAADTTESEGRNEQLRHHTIVLREYAKWALLRSYVFPSSREAHRRELIQQFFQLGSSVKLTERDIVLLMYKGIFTDDNAA